MGRYVGTGKNRRYQIKKGKRWVFAKAPSGGKSRKAARRTTRRVTTVAKRRRTTKRKSSSGKPKLPSLSKTLALVGAGAVVSGTVATAAARAMDAAAPMLALVGISTGAGVLAAAVAAKALCSASPWFRAKWTGFLRGWGFRP